MSEIGKNILRRRKELGMTQEELATKMGYKSKSSINKIELGINDIVQTKVVKFAEVLKTTPAYIMGWEEEQKNNDIISDAVIRMRTNEDFLSVVKKLMELDDEQVKGVNQMLNAFVK